MISLSIARKVAAPSARAWQMISGAELRDFVTGVWIQGVTVDGDGGAGSILTVTMLSGAVIKERIEGYDPVEQEFSWSVVDSGPTNYALSRGTLRVQPAGPDACIISQRSTFIVEDGTEEASKETWTNNTRAKLKLIGEYLEAQVAG